MVSTRSATSSPVKKSTSSPTKQSKPTATKPIALQTGDALKFVIAPKNISEDSRFLLLNHPHQLVPKRFLFCPKTGLYEFTRIAAPSFDPRSILCSPSSSTNDSTPADAISRGYVTKTAEYVTATPFDVSFLLVKTLASKKKLFQPLDDLLEDLEAQDKHFTYILQHGRMFVEDAISRICDSMDAGDEKMFRYNEEKLLKHLLGKARSAVARGLPASLEERFVTRALEMPVLSVKREDTVVSSTVSGEEEEAAKTPDAGAEDVDSQSATTSSAASSTGFSQTSSASTSVTTIATTTEEAVPSEVYHLQRIRTAFNFITSSYIHSDIAANLEAALDSNQSLGIDWTALHKHLERIAELRAEAATSRSFGDFSKKRGNLDDDEEAQVRAEKKLKLEEEEKRKKANLSRGVRELSKVNVTGMKKMSAFFSKKPDAVKAKT